MTLRQQQSKFALLAVSLIAHADRLGYEVTLGDAYRDPRCGYGSKSSQHHNRLAIDLNLFRDGVYLTATEDHEQLGRWWEAQDRDCRWGGWFRGGDGNHYELTPNWRDLMTELEGSND